MLITDLAESVGFNHGTSGSVDYSWGWITSAWDDTLIRSLVYAKWECNPRSILKGSFEASFIFITAHDDNLKIFLSVRVPGVVKVFQASLEGFASTSPGSGVDNHDEFVPIDSFSTNLRAITL